MLKQTAGLRGKFSKNEPRVISACTVDKSKVISFTDAVNKHFAKKAKNESYKGYQPYDNYRNLLSGKDTADQLGRLLRWNPEKEKFGNDAEANKLLSRPVRTKWTS
ncbi:hypothetical protein WBJ53_25690 [Spirosoma sp. SC4-14]|uniref:hypothetical protein n=1 Tax=Spirosoma sp. SC4-14 TaxID=3128900 RepID=UPI0030CD0C8C